MDEVSSTMDQPVSAELTSSIQVLILPPGVYSFTIRGGAGQRAYSPELVQPALQVGLAPIASSASVEFLTGGSTFDRWLAYDTDMIVVRIFDGDASLLLTSVRMPDSPVLDVDVKRLNAESVSQEFDEAATQAESGSRSASPQVRLLTHIKNVGDLQFEDSWAGWPGQQLWIEAFSISAVGDLPDDSMEYCGVTIDGVQTPWLSGEELCGSRGAGMPMLGFAVRLKPAAAEKYDCAYSGKFCSGAAVGPLKNGDVCCSAVPGDPLEGIEVRITKSQKQEISVPAPNFVSQHAPES